MILPLLWKLQGRATAVQTPVCFLLLFAYHEATKIAKAHLHFQRRRRRASQSVTRL